MKTSRFLFLLIFLFPACREENPAPEVFLDYDSPYYEGIDGGKLHELDEDIKLGLFGDIHSLLIIRNDKIVFENYYSKYQRDDLQPIGAATQSLISTLLGTYQYSNESFDLLSKIINYFPEYAQYFENIPQKDQIDIRHLLSHTSGLWWDEWTHPFGTDANDAYVMSLSDDWVENILATPMIREPGNSFNFNSGNAVLMAPLMEKLTGVGLDEYAEQKLFKPLNITDWRWERIPGEYVNAAWGLHMRPIDLAKIGYLFINNGKWNDQELFNEIWRVRSTRRRYSVSSYFGYGYYWWGFSNNADVVRLLKTNDVFFSWGDGGQFLFVVPHLKLVVVTTAGNFNNNETKAIQMLRDYIFVAISDRFY
jgi:CubicO group peptidase (beta-lactamase class C family)